MMEVVLPFDRSQDFGAHRWRSSETPYAWQRSRRDNRFGVRALFLSIVENLEELLGRSVPGEIGKAGERLT